MKTILAIIITLVIIAGAWGVYSWYHKQNSQASAAQKKVELQIGEGIIHLKDPYANITQDVDFNNKTATVKYGGNSVKYIIKDVLQPFNLDGVGDVEYPFLLEADYSDGKKIEYLVIARADKDKFQAVDIASIGNPARIDEIHAVDNREVVAEAYIGENENKELVLLSYSLSNDKIIPSKNNVDIDNTKPKPKVTPTPTPTNTTSSPKPTATTSQKKTTKGNVALSFDDGPGKYTPDFLDVLKNKGVKATFFIIGQNAESKPDYVQRVQNEGHEIGNHTYTHPDMKKLAYDAQMDEISKCNKVLKNIISSLNMNWFRPPFGNFNDDTTNILSKLGMTKMLWNVDTRDWSGKSASEIASAALDGVGDGAIILMHDGVANSSETVKALPQIIDGIRDRGFSMVTISELKGK